MKKQVLFTSIAMLVIGTIGRLYADNYTYIDANNLLHDSVWLPIGTLLMLLGFLLLIISAVLYGVGYLKSRS